MAIVEDEVRNDSEEENEIEVYVEEDDADQDSDDSEIDDDDELLERKVAELEGRINEDPYNYDDHIDLIQTLWSLSELDKWRAAFDRLQQMTILRPEHWLLRLQTEETLAHSEQSHDFMAYLFQQASLDCYSIPILSLWCSWAMSTGAPDVARAQLSEVLKLAGSNPFSGKLFWDTRLELEKTELETLSEDEENYKAQNERVLWCLEEMVSRPLLRGEEAWQQFNELALTLHDQKYVDKVKKQHDAAVDYLQKITPYEDKLLTTESPEEKCKIYQEYIQVVDELSQQEKYSECDSSRILMESASRATIRRVLDACVRRCPRKHTFWTLKMQQAEHEEKDFDEVKSIFETALSKGMETYQQGESLWMSYLEYCRRQTNFDSESDVERLRRTFRLAWDSLAEAWGDEANDCEVPLFWAQLEYKRMNDPKQGKEIFEEIFKYGENKSMSKYWEALLQLESTRGGSEQKLRELHRRALQCVRDYPPAVARMWRELERTRGPLPAARACAQLCDAKLKEWRENYQAMKDKMMGSKQKSKQGQGKKTKSDTKVKSRDNKDLKGKRKSVEEEHGEGSGVKRKKCDMEVGDGTKESDTGGGVKRSHEQDDEDPDTKRQRRDSSSSSSQPASREACTLFVSNLEFKVNEQHLRDKLSEFGNIVSMRVKAGVKAFGGSICYCQYKTPDSVEEALKHDRTPLDGRPMFLSRYSANKSKSSFKYATTVERNKLFVKNLPYDQCTKDALTKTFDKYGSLKDIRIVTFKDGKPKGLAYIEYENEESAAKALKETDGLQLGDRKLQVAISEPPPKAAPTSTPTLGQSKRDSGGGMRRTQLSSFIPSVLQKPSTSKSSVANGSHANGEENRPLSNTDFRNMLLK
ncbi:squamous cell carcinoma antigen recognized by T-cells 3 isoform X2 [Battus philenor]|uniref:squamous cell carcinoma antigen recognized by T-cells 3 isoform X2 n=1 Tax=Battus philenor TaxID=42288 RepID=UPI0035D0846C